MSDSQVSHQPDGSPELASFPSPQYSDSDSSSGGVPVPPEDQHVQPFHRAQLPRSSSASSINGLFVAPLTGVVGQNAEPYAMNKQFRSSFEQPGADSSSKDMSKQQRGFQGPTPPDDDEETLEQWLETQSVSTDTQSGGAMLTNSGPEPVNMEVRAVKSTSLQPDSSAITPREIQPRKTSGISTDHSEVLAAWSSFATRAQSEEFDQCSAFRARKHGPTTNDARSTQEPRRRIEETFIRTVKGAHPGERRKVMKEKRIIIG
ncbi:hypothetical protein EJ05DRAFT_490591 [Pseudovirgaria hyperparasitica]|uniref:Uncharacterized protein n=1 Tax=Pseudovirgaria hyperparasitica TaxID=470096 RepID=A0A6A6VSY5_9PEZI|nr:uncharacterized protein EJ05DRAFT_490591 [Pseudovirgaria hyperparasitica]KAF2752896.1 hypothetical protein EJ05DRAFT_490591 [Pseudovirgaria hyperparasitica]